MNLYSRHKRIFVHLRNRSARRICCWPVCLGCLFEPSCHTSTASAVSQGPEATREVGVPSSGLWAGLSPRHPTTKASCFLGLSPSFWWKWALVFQEPLTREGPPNQQAASPTTACLPHPLPPGQRWKILSLYPETVSCITYRSELFIIPLGLQ